MDPIEINFEDGETIARALAEYRSSQLEAMRDANPRDAVWQAPQEAASDTQRLIDEIEAQL